LRKFAKGLLGVAAAIRMAARPSSVATTLAGVAPCREVRTPANWREAMPIEEFCRSGGTQPRRHRN